MRAIQVVWSAPAIHSARRQKEGTNSLDPTFAQLMKHRAQLGQTEAASAPSLDDSPHRLLTMILSVLQWKRLNGVIKLYTDSIALSRYKEWGILDLWDEVDTRTLEQIDQDAINPAVFWAAGKIYAYAQEQEPFFFFDHDLIVWRKLDAYVSEADVCFTHWEESGNSPWYKELRELRCPPDYRFDPDWEGHPQRLSVNTSSVYFNHMGLKEVYVREALRFMKGNRIPDPPLVGTGAAPEAVFMEQSLLPLCVQKMGLRMRPLVDAVWGPVEGRFIKHDARFGRWDFFQVPNTLLTHCWIHKSLLDWLPYLSDAYCKDLLREIKKSFPEMMERLRGVRPLNSYLEGLQDGRRQRP